MKAVKGNREYDIEQKDVETYRKDGFDISDDKGNIIAYGAGKSVSYDKYEALKAENEAHKAENETHKAENETLKAENEALKKENKTLKAAKETKGTKSEQTEG